MYRLSTTIDMPACIRLYTMSENSIPMECDADFRLEIIKQKALLTARLLKVYYENNSDLLIDSNIVINFSYNIYFNSLRLTIIGELH